MICLLLGMVMLRRCECVKKPGELKSSLDERRWGDGD